MEKMQMDEKTKKELTEKIDEAMILGIGIAARGARVYSETFIKRFKFSGLNESQKKIMFDLVDKVLNCFADSLEQAIKAKREEWKHRN
jgi:hypothetical protein